MYQKIENRIISALNTSSFSRSSKRKRKRIKSVRRRRSVNRKGRSVWRSVNRKGRSVWRSVNRKGKSGWKSGWKSVYRKWRSSCAWRSFYFFVRRRFNFHLLQDPVINFARMFIKKGLYMKQTRRLVLHVQFRQNEVDFLFSQIEALEILPQTGGKIFVTNMFKTQSSQKLRAGLRS
jgi:hypothetical protein